MLYSSSAARVKIETRYYDESYTVVVVYEGVVAAVAVAAIVLLACYYSIKLS